MRFVYCFRNPVSVDGRLDLALVDDDELLDGVGQQVQGAAADLLGQFAQQDVRQAAADRVSSGWPAPRVSRTYVN